MTEITWNDELKAFCRAAGGALETARLLAPVISAAEASDCLPRMPSEPAHSLYSNLLHELRQLERRAGLLFERLSAAPAAALLSGHRLTSEQFYALRCAGVELPSVRARGLPACQEYELYVLMHYEDEDRIGWINPGIAPTEPERCGGRFGIAPEDVRVGSLRTDQVKFFREYLPATFARFRSH